ncbi:unnamed protein product [Closterium sp. Naga37s-1]|nr:unnamed protein product [Closterium sp. Naga37s-1]
MAADNNEDNLATRESGEAPDEWTESDRADTGVVTQTGDEEEEEAEAGAEGEGEQQEYGEGGAEAEGEDEALLSFLEEQGESVTVPLYWSAVKKIVAGYIQANGLQKGKWITCDDALQALCDTDRSTQAQFYYTLATHYPVKSSIKVPRRLLKRQVEEEAAKMGVGEKGKRKGKGARGGEEEEGGDEEEEEEGGDLDEKERDEQGEEEQEQEEEERKGEGRRGEEEDSWEKDWSSREGVTQEHDMAEENEEQMKTGKEQQPQQQQDEEEAFSQDFGSRANSEPSPRKRKRGRPPKASRDNPSATTATAASTAAATATEPNHTRYSDPFASDPFSSDPDAPEVTDLFAPSPSARAHSDPFGPSSSAFPPAPPAPPPGPECGYAAVTLANLGGVFLKRRQLEGLLADEGFDRKVVGTFVRIRVPGPANQTEACYRLVRVTGCTSQTEMYPVGKGLTNRVLLIMNLKTPEATTIDLVSNSDFTEEECQKLRQYMNWGLVDRLTVDEVAAKEIELHELKVNQSVLIRIPLLPSHVHLPSPVPSFSSDEVAAKEMELHELKVNDWLDAERVKLTNLRDRAREPTWT